MGYNPELIKRLAMGDESAQEEIKNLPLSERMGLSLASDQYRQENNVRPLDDNMTIYTKDKKSGIDSEALAESMAKLNKESDAKKKAQAFNDKENYNKAWKARKRF